MFLNLSIKNISKKHLHIQPHNMKEILVGGGKFEVGHIMGFYNVMSHNQDFCLKIHTE